MNIIALMATKCIPHHSGKHEPLEPNGCICSSWLSPHCIVHCV